MEQEIQKMFNLAKDWCNFSQKVNGWGIKEYKKKDCRVWCYFSDDRTHTAVHFRNDGIDIAFHSIPTISFQIHNGNKQYFQKIRIKYSKFLKEIRIEYKNQKEIENAKETEINALERRLKEIKEEKKCNWNS